VKQEHCWNTGQLFEKSVMEKEWENKNHPVEMYCRKAAGYVDPIAVPYLALQVAPAAHRCRPDLERLWFSR